jgi:hypothetical protein
MLVCGRYIGVSNRPAQKKLARHGHHGTVSVARPDLAPVHSPTSERVDTIFHISALWESDEDENHMPDKQELRC